MENSVLQFEAPKYQSSYIKVIGVGGGGTNAVNHMYNTGIEGVDFIVCNTDNKSLDTSPVPIKIQLGKSGLGAGNIPAVARDRALEVGDKIKELLFHNTQMLFITAGMGGGTGTGAAPVIAKLAKEVEIDDDVNKILVVAIVTLPFSFEGRRRRLQAEEGIRELRKHVDAILIVNNDKLRDFGKMDLREAFSKADDILLAAAKGIAEIITVKSYVAIDFRDVNTVMQDSGVALMGSGIAEGPDRALRAIEMATSSPLLNDNNIRGAKNILLYISSGSVDMDEMGDITDYISQEVDSEVDVIWGVGFDESLGEKLSITLVATGFESKEFDIAEKRDNIIKNPIVKPVTAPAPEQEGKGNVFVLEIENEEEAIAQMEVGIEPEKQVQTVTHESFDPAEEPMLISQMQETVVTNETSQTKIVAEEHVDFNNSHEVNETNEELHFEIIEKKPIPSNNIEINEQEKIAVEVPFSAQNTSTEDYLKQRAERMRLINEKLKNPQGLEELEKIPAYKLFGMDLKEPQHSSKSEVSRMTLNGEKPVEEGNPFIYDQPD